MSNIKKLLESLDAISEQPDQVRGTDNPRPGVGFKGRLVGEDEGNNTFVEVALAKIEQLGRKRSMDFGDREAIRQSLIHNINKYGANVDSVMRVVDMLAKRATKRQGYAGGDTEALRQSMLHALKKNQPIAEEEIEESDKFLGGAYHSEEDPLEEYAPAGVDASEENPEGKGKYMRNQQDEINERRILADKAARLFPGNDPSARRKRQNYVDTMIAGETRRHAPKNESSMYEALTIAHEDYVKNKLVADEKKTLKVVKKGDAYVVKNEKGVEVCSGSKTDCTAYVDKKNKSLNDAELVEGDLKDTGKEVYEVQFKVVPNFKRGRPAGVTSLRQELEAMPWSYYATIRDRSAFPAKRAEILEKFPRALVQYVKTTEKTMRDEPVTEATLSEASPLGSVGFSDQFINAVYRKFSLANTELPDPVTMKPSPGSLQDRVFISRTKDGNAFAIGSNDHNPRFSWGGQPSATLISEIDGKITYSTDAATTELKKVPRGEYYAIPFSGYTRSRNQGTTDKKRANPKPAGHEGDDSDKADVYVRRVEEVYGDRIRSEMSRVVDFIHTNIRKFDTTDPGWRQSDQKAALDVANSLAKLSKTPVDKTRYQGAWDNQTYLEMYLHSLGRLAHGFASVPNNYRNFLDVMDESPIGLARFAKFILGTVRKYEETIRNMLYKNTHDALTKDYAGESIEEEVSPGHSPAVGPAAAQLAGLMNINTREESFKYLDMLRNKYGKEFSMKAYRMAQSLSKGRKDPSEVDVDEDDNIDEGKWFQTQYGWAGGAKPGGGTYKHPDQIKADRQSRAKAKSAASTEANLIGINAAEKRKSKSPVAEARYLMRLYPDLPDNPHPNHPYQKLPSRELAGIRDHQSELAEKLGTEGAAEKARIAAEILCVRSREAHYASQREHHAYLDAEKIKRQASDIRRLTKLGLVTPNKKTNEDDGASKETWAKRGIEAKVAQKRNDEKFMAMTTPHQRKMMALDQKHLGRDGYPIMKKKVSEGKSENRQLWDRIKSKGVGPDIDREKYTDLSHEGLEGPFRMKTGKVLYYDPKEGKYYDREKDMYVSHEDMDHINRHGLGEGKSPEKMAKIKKLRALLDKFSDTLGETKKRLVDDGLPMVEAPIDQTVAPAPVAGQPPKPGQQPQVPGATAKTAAVKPVAPGTLPAPGKAMTPAQQAPAPAGVATAAPVAGQPVPPAAGQAGGAPVAPPAGAVAPPTGTAVNAATTPTEQMKALVQTMAANPAAAKQLGVKLNSVK